MSDTEGDALWLFSYGTLQQEEVQLATFGRRLEGRPDILAGYGTSLVAIADPAVVAMSGKTHHPIVRATGNDADEIAGTLFRLTRAEFAAADAYEVADYKRIAVRLKSGLEAFVYVAV